MKYYVSLVIARSCANFSVQYVVDKVLQTAYKVGKDGIEAGTSLVPVS